jgi:hypothetical protein
MLYIAKFDLIETRYMGHTRRQEGLIRLIEADSEEAALEKLKKAVEHDDPYCSSLYADVIEINEIIK